MRSIVLFRLVSHGRVGNVHSSLSAYDDTGTSGSFVDQVNQELQDLPHCATQGAARIGALVVLKRHGFDKPDADWWFADPRQNEAL